MDGQSCERSACTETMETFFGVEVVPGEIIEYVHPHAQLHLCQVLRLNHPLLENHFMVVFTRESSHCPAAGWQANYPSTCHCINLVMCCCCSCLMLCRDDALTSIGQQKLA